ncbi:MAG: Uncharacterized conserved protein, DUF1501 family [Chloroflexi bacterium]|nr:MAG: Uncharacterized conserved protein, DUF1501 family [Chloroflexota bacterium]
MTTTRQKAPVLVVIELKGGLDFMNTVIPYQSGVIRDARPNVSLPIEDALPINDELAWHPAAKALNALYDAGDVAVVQGVGWENSSRSHFRAMDIWHTCEPDVIATEGWLAKVTREFDPGSANPLTAVSFGRGLPRALAASGVTVTSIANLDQFGLMTKVEVEEERTKDLDSFKRMYTPGVGSGIVQDYLAQTGRSVLKSADMLADVPSRYSSGIEYAPNSIAQALRDVVRVHTADLGTRIFYTQHPGYDLHANESVTQPQLLTQLTEAIADFMDDLRGQDASQEVTVLVFSEFGRRIKDNGSGTDHGSAGGAYLIGDGVAGGLYGAYPSIEPKDWLNGEDLRPTIDFRSVYSSLLDQWMGIDPTAIVGGAFEQITPYAGKVGTPR